VKTDFLPEEELLVGGIFPLSGYLSWSGEHKMNGAALKIAMINEAGGVDGRRLSLVTYDDRSSPQEAARVAEMLVQKHRVIAIVGTGSLPISAAVAQVANRTRIPAFLNSGYTIDPARDLYVFNTSHKTEFALACSLQHFLETGIDRLALLMPKGPLGDLGSWLGRRLSEELGIRIVGEERFNVDAPEVGPQLLRLSGLKPLALFSFATGHPAAKIAATMGRLSMRIPLLVSHGNANPSFLANVSRIPVPLVIPSGRMMALDSIPEGDPAKIRVSDFNRRHMACFGEPANYCSAESADAIDLLVQGLRRAGKAEGGRLRDAVEDIRDFEGLQGVYDFSPIDHHGTHVEHVVLLTLDEGAWRHKNVFSSVRLFEAFHGLEKTRLIFRLAGELTRPCPRAHPQETARADRSMAAEIGLNCTNLKGDPCFVVRLAHQQKRELLNAFRDENYPRARECLCRAIVSNLLQYYDTPELLRLSLSELFHAFFDAAAREEGADVEGVAQLKRSCMTDFARAMDQEALCSWTVRTFEEVVGLLRERRRERGTGLLKSVLRFIEEHVGEDLTVDRIAREVALSPSRLIHRIRGQYGLTLSDCITEARINGAKALLRDTDMAICEIAHQVGYSDQSYFTRVFRKSLNCTPRAFRDAAKEKPGRLPCTTADAAVPPIFS
jgi:branched-chain amino acid transport system substrate-binding protein